MEEQKRRLVTTFDLASTTYDAPALRFFNVHALALVQKAEIQEGARVLDAATGSGKVALEAARVVGLKG
jgi:ubiquinone/menaquinone biosynthesis C-methylase UbiE